MPRLLSHLAKWNPVAQTQAKDLQPLRTDPRTKAYVARRIAERGRMGWQRASGYKWRALVESDVSRWKRVIGDGLRSRTDGRQETEVAIAATALNRMLDLGRPNYVRIA